MLDILDGIIATAAVVLGLSLIVQAIQQITKQILSLKSTYMRRELLALFGMAGEASLSKSLVRTLRMQLSGRPEWMVKSVDALLGFVPQWSWKMIDMIPENVQPLPIQSLRASDTAYEIVQQLSEKMMSFGYKDLEMLENVKKDDLKKMAASLPMFDGIDPEKDKLEELLQKAQQAREQVQKMQPAQGLSLTEAVSQRLAKAQAQEQITRLKAQALKRLQQALRDIETWFDITMKAFQDHYERRMRLWATILSALVVITVNADLVDIYREFSTSKPRRDAVLASVPALMETAKREIASDTAKASCKAVNLDSLIQHKLSVAESLATDKSFELIRWNTSTGDSLRFIADLGGNFGTGISDFAAALWRNFLGWLGMTLLVSLGAPFWYDTLKAIMGIKETLKRK